jgi:hypothetical protein
MKNLTAVQITSQVVIIAMYLSIALFEEGLICSDYTVLKDRILVTDKPKYWEVDMSHLMYYLTISV